MNWITNFVRPKLQAFVGKKEVPDNLWETCPKCSQMLLKRELENNSFVCKHCDHHFRISAKQRLSFFLGNNFMVMDTPKVKADPLKFKDNKKYSDLFSIGIGTDSLGYSHPLIDKKVLKTIANGNMTSLNSTEEIHLAERLISMHSWADQVRFTRSGGEANTLAVRLARAYTKKNI